MSGIKLPDDCGALLKDIKDRVRAAQYEALRAVNKELIGLYWDIGRIICERQAGGSGWGKSVVANLAGDLQQEFKDSPLRTSGGCGNFTRHMLEAKNSHHW